MKILIHPRRFSNNIIERTLITPQYSGQLNLQTFHRKQTLKLQF